MTKNTDKESQVESMSELEQIEGNYYMMDFFVAFALVLFTVWVFLAEKNFVWTVFLALLASLFFIRGIRNWKRRGGGDRAVLP